MICLAPSGFKSHVSVEESDVAPGESETEGGTHMDTQTEMRRGTKNTDARSRESSESQVLPPVSGWASPRGVWGQIGHPAWHSRSRLIA